MSQKIKIIFHFLFYLLLVSPSFGQTASILPQGYTQYFDANGNPLSAGKVHNYVPGTLTLKNTWQDSGETILNTNPVILDAAGKAKILGQGAYRQIVNKSDNSLVWDAVTSSTGTGGTTASTGDGDLVGTIKPWAGITAPNQYAFTYGQEVSRATFSVLMTAITQTINNIVCTSGNPILNGFSDTTSINYGSAVEISCMAPGTTVVSKTSSTVTVSNNATISNTVTGVFYPFGNGDGSTTFNLPDLRGRAVAGRDNMGGVVAGRLTTAFFGTNSPDAQGGTGGSQSHLIIQAEEPQHRHTITVTDPGHTHTVTASLLGGSTFTAGGVSGQATSPTPITSSSNTTGITSNSSYSGSIPTTVTITAASPAVVSWTAHGFSAGQQVTFQTTGVLPTGITAGVTYFVIAAGLATNSFEISATLGGSAINTSGGSGTHNGQALVTNTPFATIQPTMTMNYIIKTTPDTNSALATGVTDIAGMTGSIGCGTGLLCTGNTIAFATGVGNVTGPNSAVDGNVVLFNGTSGHIIKDGGTTVRIRATSDLNLYVRSDGSNTLCTGLVDAAASAAPNCAFKTIQFGASTIMANYDLACQNGTIWVTVAGTYAENIILGSYVGRCTQGHTGPVLIRGIAANPSGVFINPTTGTVISASSTSYLEWDIKDLKVKSNDSNCFTIDAAAWIVLDNVERNGCSTTGIQVLNGGKGEIISNSIVSGGGQIDTYVTAGGQLYYINNPTITYTGGPTFSAFSAGCDTGGYLLALGVTFTGSVTGIKWNGAGFCNLVVTGGIGNLNSVFPGTINGSWTPISLAQGGTNSSLIADNGGILWSNATQLQILAHTTTAALPLLSGNAATPSWATITYPASATSGGVAYFSSTTAMASSAILGTNQVVSGGGAGNPPVVSPCLLGTGTSLSCTSASSSTPQFVLINTTSDNSSPQFLFQKSRSGGNTNSADNILDFLAFGFANTAPQPAGRIQILQAAASSGSNVPAKIVFTTSNASGQLNLSMTLDNAGTLTIPNGVASTSKTTGTLIVTGGIGNSGAHFTDTLNIITVANAATTAALCWNSGTGLVTENGAVGTCTVSLLSAKDLIKPLTNQEGFNIVMAMEPWRYTMKPNKPTWIAGEQIGFIADYADKIDIAKSVVVHNHDGSLGGFRYEQYTAALTAAFKYLKADNDNLNERLKVLESRK